MSTLEPLTKSNESGSDAPTNSLTRADVLLVHRIPLVRLAVRTLINASPRLALCGATDFAPEAAELFRRLRPQLVVLGLTLRGGDGIGLLKDLRKCDSTARCIVLTMREDALSIQRAFRGGACAYLVVQDATEEIAQTLESALDGKLHASNRVCHTLLEELASGAIKPVNHEMRALSDRELEVLSLIGRGFGASRLACELHVSVKTIETHQMRIKQKLGLRSAAELSERASRWMVELARWNLSSSKQLRAPRRRSLANGTARRDFRSQLRL